MAVGCGRKYRMMAISSLIGGALVHLTLGTIYTYSNMAPYIISYIRNRSHPTNLRGVDAPWVFASAAVGQSLSMYFGGMLAQKLSVRLSTALGCSALVSGVMLSYLTIKVSYWVFLVTYGVMYGVGAGLAYIGPLYSVIRWFPSHKGLVNGIIVAGYGGGALVFNFVQTQYLNPHNYSPTQVCHDHSHERYFDNESLLNRVPSSFLFLGGIYFIIQFVGCLMIFEPRKSSGNRRCAICCDGSVDPETDVLISPTTKDMMVSPYNGYSSIPIDASYNSGNSNASYLDSMAGYHQALIPSNHKPTIVGGKTPQYLLVNDSYEQKKAREETLRSEHVIPDGHYTQETPLSEQGQMEPVSMRPIELLRDINFYLLWLMFLLNTEAVIFVTSVNKFFGETFVSSDRLLTTVASVASGFNAGGRIFWGVISDKGSFKLALVIMTCLTTVFLSTFYLTKMADSSALYFIWTCMVFMCLGGSYSIFPTAVCQLFGPRHMAANYGMLFTAHAVSAITGALLSTSFSDSVGWRGSFLTIACFSGMGFLLSLVVRERKILRLVHQ